MTTSVDRTPGRIITFYSYKGGTGRSMAVANVGWLFASAGKCVLLVDWDLEAPGLHRYFHPFLEDPELTDSPGLIDWAIDVESAARQHERLTTPSSVGAESIGADASAEPSTAPADDPRAASEAAVPTVPVVDRARRWWEQYASLLSVTVPIEFDFPSGGALHLVPSGVQDAGYASRVTRFDWEAFYSQLGGGVLIEALKASWREDYDYVLIDSRTGISDTSGICTIHLPDDLVVCFTLNNQSIAGACAVAASAELQRTRPNGEPGVRIWPVPTRVELGEDDRLNSARTVTREKFGRFLRRLPRSERNSYWGRIETVYKPAFAYEEVLATISERRGQTLSVLASMEELTLRLSREPLEIVDLPESQRLELLARYRRPSLILTSSRPMVYLNYPSESATFAARVVDLLRDSGVDVWWDMDLVPGDVFATASEEAIQKADAMLVIADQSIGDKQGEEIERAERLNKRIIPLATNLVVLRSSPLLSQRTPVLVNGSADEQDRKILRAAAAQLVQLAERERPATLSQDPEDPQKGRWGGQSEREGRRLTASVKELTTEWFEVTITVMRVSGAPLTDAVVFHLHPTFTPPVKSVTPSNGVASMTLSCWGAFTVGAVTDAGSIQLELDLSSVDGYPNVFVER